MSKIYKTLEEWDEWGDSGECENCQTVSDTWQAARAYPEDKISRALGVLDESCTRCRSGAQGQTVPNCSECVILSLAKILVEK